MELPQSNTQTPVYSYTRTELLSSRTKTSLLNLSTVDRLKDLNIGYHGGGGVDPISCVSTHRISDPRSGPAKLLSPHVKQRSYPHGVRPQIPDR